MIGTGSSALREWLEENASELGLARAHTHELTEWAAARAGEVELAKLARNKAELQVLALKDLVRSLAAAAPQLGDVEAAIEEATSLATVGPIEQLVAAARELVAIRTDSAWRFDPFATVQKLGARLVDLAEAVAKVDHTPRKAA